MKNWFLLACLSCSLFLTSCDQDEDITQQAPRLEVYLSDDPADFDEVNIEIVDVQVNINADQQAWESLESFTPTTVNLLKFTGGLDTLLGAIDVPSARLQQIRLLLGDNNYLVIQGASVPLRTPSAQQSGLKIQINEDLMAGVVYKLILDFDAGRSIVEAGNSGNFNLKPVIRATLEAQSGSITGSIQPDSIQTLVTAFNNNDTISSFNNDAGIFLLRGVPPGTYNVNFSPTDTLFQEQTLNNIEVVINQSKDLGSIILNQ